jgi:hypothetical protein
MNVKVNRNGIVGVIIFALLALLALETRPVSDWIVRAMILAVVVGGSVFTIVKMVRHKHMTPYGQTSVLPRGLSRWLLGESDDHSKPN